MTSSLFFYVFPIFDAILPFFRSDFKDGIHIQSLASYVFIYFACLTPIVTFGGLLGDATENRIAAIESLVSGLIVGVSYGMFSGMNAITKRRI